MGGGSPSWSDDRDGRDAANDAKFSANGAGRSAAAAGARAGAIGWLRANLLSSPGNIALTLMCVALIAWIVPPLLRFLLIDAVWSGSDGAGLSGDAGSSGDRCLLGVRADLVFLFRLWLLSGRATLAGRCVFPEPCVRLGLAIVVASATPRHRRALLLRRIADPGVRRCCTACRCWDWSKCRPRCGAAFW